MISTEFKNAKPDMSLIPSFATLTESVFYIVEANEIDFNNMMQKIGITELGLFESTGSVLLYEQDSEEAKTAEEAKDNFAAGFFTRIKTLFENALRKIGNLIKSFITKITLAFGKKALAKENLEKFKQFIPTMDDKYTVSRYPWEGLRDFLTISSGQEMKDDLEKFAEELNKSLQQGQNVSTLAQNNTTKEIQNYLRSEEANINNIPEEVKKEDVKINSIEDDFEYIFNSCTNFKDTENKIKLFYKTMAETGKVMIKTLKELKTDKDSIYRAKNGTTFSLKVVGLVLSEFYAMIGSNMKIVTTVYKAYNKAGKTEDNKTEETNTDNKEEKVGESAIDSELSSLFSWSY